MCLWQRGRTLWKEPKPDWQTQKSYLATTKTNTHGHFTSSFILKLYSLQKNQLSFHLRAMLWSNKGSHIARLHSSCASFPSVSSGKLWKRGLPAADHSVMGMTTSCWQRLRSVRQGEKSFLWHSTRHFEISCDIAHIITHGRPRGRCASAQLSDLPLTWQRSCRALHRGLPSGFGETASLSQCVRTRIEKSSF